MVVGLGLTTVDILMPLQHEIVPHTKNLVVTQIMQLGGVVPTGLVTLSRFGVLSSLYSCLGNDAPASLLMDILKKEDINTGGVVRIPEVSPLATVLIHHDTGERTNFYSRGAYPTLEPSRFPVEFPKDCQLFIVDAHNAAASKHFMENARSAHVPILLDLGNLKPGTDSLIPLATIVIAPQAFWKVQWPSLQPREVVDVLLKEGPDIVVVTMGTGGCFVGKKGEKTFYQPAFPVHALDTNGAGDIFMGALAYGVVSLWSLSQTVRFAAGASAFSCMRVGKEQKIPRSVKDVEIFLQGHSENSYEASPTA